MVCLIHCSTIDTGSCCVTCFILTSSSWRSRLQDKLRRSCFSARVFIRLHLILPFYYVSCDIRNFLLFIAAQSCIICRDVCSNSSPINQTDFAAKRRRGINHVLCEFVQWRTMISRRSQDPCQSVLVMSNSPGMLLTLYLLLNMNSTKLKVTLCLRTMMWEV
jgi:hypothetical protein